MAHEGTPYGHVTINGKPASVKQIASIAGIAEKECAKLIRELEEAGVFSRADDDAILSRRMVKDHKASLEGKEWVSKRYANKGDDEKPTTTPTRAATPTPSTLEARSKKQELSSALAGLENVKPCPDTGRPTVGGWYLDRTQERVFDAAKIDNARWTGNIKPLIAWLAEGIEPDTIVAAVTRRAEQAGYSVPHSLAYFDKPIRESHGRAAS